MRSLPNLTQSNTRFMFRPLFKCFAVLIALAVACPAFAAEPLKKKSIKALMVGGGASHDFNRWYKGEDLKTLNADGLANVTYTDDPSTILAHLPTLDVLILSNNQPIPDDATRKAIFDFLNRGKGVVLLHAAIWYNWKDWPAYNQQIVGGGSRGHDKYGPFEMTVTQPKHPVMKGVPSKFTLADELYYHKLDPDGAKVEVLATAQMAGKAESYPNIFTVAHAKGRIVGIGLGHDAASHELPAYQTILKNAVKWAAKKK
jgi:type 1 glutamine amidotransferase